MFLKAACLSLIALVATTMLARGQEAVSSITQSRLFPATPAPAPELYDANGNAVADREASSSGDDSFGTQIILKNQERPKSFAAFGDVSLSYTNNVELTPDNTRSDAFAMANIGVAWRPVISRRLIGEFALATSIFRYDQTSELDFERISAAAALSWVVPHGRGIVAFGRYDFTEVIDTSSHELLQDHTFTGGGQRTFNFGRSHFLTVGVSGSIGISDPESQERDQAGAYLAYHLQLTRTFGADLIYRYAAQFYSDDDRIDHNQTLSLMVGVAVNRWLRVDTSLSGAHNDSNRSMFEYDVVNVGGAVRLSVRF